MKLILLAVASALAQGEVTCTTQDDGLVCCNGDSYGYCTSPLGSYGSGLGFSSTAPSGSGTGRATSPGSLGNSVSGSSITTRATSSNGVQVMVCEAGGGGCWDQDMPVSQQSGRSYTTITQTPGATQDDDHDNDDVSSAGATGSPSNAGASNSGASNAGASNAGSSAARSSAAVGSSNRAAVVSVCGGVVAMLFANLL